MIATGVLLSLLLVLPSAQQADAAATDFEALASTDPDLASQAWQRLIQLGPTAAEAALQGFASRPELERRARILVLHEVAQEQQIEQALPLTSDPSGRVRLAVVELLARPDLGSSFGQERRASLKRLALEDSDPRVRLAAISGLGVVEAEGVLEDLIELALTAPAEDAVAAVQALPEGRRAWPAAHQIVHTGLDSPDQRCSSAVLAQALPLYAYLLADRAAGGVDADDWAPLVLAGRHPATEVRIAASLAYERLLARLRELGEGEHARALLAQLAAAGLDARVVHAQRARLAFYPEGNARAAAEAARAMRTAELGADRPRDRLWLLRSLYLEAVAELGAGEIDAGATRLERASAVLEGLLGERRDQRNSGPHPVHVEALALGSTIDLCRALALQMGAENKRAQAVALLREAHRGLLEAQLARTRSGGGGYASWNAILDGDLSPFRLLFTGVPLSGLDVPRALELQAQLGRLLATAVPEEFPGFEPYPDLVSAQRDPLHRALLEKTLRARFNELSRSVDEMHSRVLDEQAANPGVLPDPEDLRRLQTLRFRRSEARKALANLEGEGARALRELRVPASLALWLARDLRTEGRSVEARRLAKRMGDDLERAGILHGFFWGLELLAEIEMSIGSSWIDQGEPKRAESELLKAVERLESIEKRLQENGAGGRQTASVRAQRCSALVSLAVNANVKLRDADKALAYFERAFELRQDEFMRVLLACYRARSGRVEEARLMLREVRPGPQTYYNLACTHALLGEKQRALEFLERELEENQFSGGSLERQKDWARDDPDLAGLRGDPRFERLVGAE